MAQQEPAFLHKPADVLTTANWLKVRFQTMLTADSKEVESCANQAFDRIKQDTSEYLHLLREATEERGISSAPLVRVGTAWESLWRCHPNPRQAIEHFRDHLPEQELIDLLTETVARLEIKARIELRALPSRAVNGLRWLAERIDAIDQANEIQMQRKLGTVGLCIIDSAQRGAFDPPCPESVLESLKPVLEKATGGAEGLIDVYDLALNSLMGWLKSNGYWPQDTPPQKPPPLAGMAKAIRTFSETLAATDANEHHVSKGSLSESGKASLTPLKADECGNDMPTDAALLMEDGSESPPVGGHALMIPMGSSVDPKAPYMPASWFRDEFGLTANALQGQLKRGNISRTKRGHWNLYSVPDSMNVWPDIVTYWPNNDP